MQQQYSIIQHLDEYFELTNKESVQDNDERVLKLISNYWCKQNYDHAALMDIIEEGGSSDDNIEVSQSEISRETYLR